LAIFRCSQSAWSIALPKIFDKRVGEIPTFEEFTRRSSIYKYCQLGNRRDQLHLKKLCKKENSAIGTHYLLVNSNLILELQNLEKQKVTYVLISLI